MEQEGSVGYAVFLLFLPKDNFSYFKKWLRVLLRDSLRARAFLETRENIDNLVNTLSEAIPSFLLAILSKFSSTFHSNLEKTLMLRNCFSVGFRFGSSGDSREDQVSLMDFRRVPASEFGSSE